MSITNNYNAYLLAKTYSIDLLQAHMLSAHVHTPAMAGLACNNNHYVHVGKHHRYNNSMHATCVGYVL